MKRIISREDMKGIDFNDLIKLSLEKAENCESVIVFKAFKDCIAVFD